MQIMQVRKIKVLKVLMNNHKSVQYEQIMTKNADFSNIYTYVCRFL